jgi:hypothetical protein
VEEKTVEGVEILRDIRAISAKAQKVAKSLEEAAGTEIEESLVSEFVAKLHKVNSSDLSKAIKELENLANSAEVPFKLREMYKKIRAELLLLANAMYLTGMSATLKDAEKSPIAPVDPAPATVDPAPAPADPVPAPAEHSHPKPASGPIPFPKIGKLAKGSYLAFSALFIFCSLLFSVI